MRNYRDFDRDHIWAFFSGGERFVGNPKYLFICINKYRPDIYAYWVSRNSETRRQIRALGMSVCNPTDDRVQALFNRTGVRVDDQVQEDLPEGMEDVKYINLWHGRQGFNKPMEQNVVAGVLVFPLAKKYIRYSVFYRNHQVFPQTAYVRNLYQRFFPPVCTYPHDIRRKKGVSENTRIALYAATFRASGEGDFDGAFPDLERLHACCEKNRLLMIFKMHGYIETESHFLRAKKAYQNRPYFLFWDNRWDIYEILQEIDLLIMDYSSIVCDAVAVGIPHYIHYIYDYEEYTRKNNISGRYEDYAVGAIVRTFDELLEAIDTYPERDETAAIERKRKEWWSYPDGKDVFEKIIDTAFAFQPGQEHPGNLYSFSVFGTLLSQDKDSEEAVHTLHRGTELVHRLSEAGHPVVLVEDTDLTAEETRTILKAADPLLAELPLFLSGEQGVTKETGELFIRVYQSFRGQYCFDNWIHCGNEDENTLAAAKKLNIRQRRIGQTEDHGSTDPAEEKIVADRPAENADEAFVRRARKKLAQRFPASEGKKVILYAPVWQTRKNCKQWLRVFDLQLLRDALGDSYAVAVYLDPGEIRGFTVNPLDLPGFSGRIHGMTEQELLAACDIVVGDYRAVFFEAVRNGDKPVFAVHADREEYLSLQDVPLTVAEIDASDHWPLVRNERELAEAVKQAENYDYAELAKCRPAAELLLRELHRKKENGLIRRIGRRAAGAILWTYGAIRLGIKRIPGMRTVYAVAERTINGGLFNNMDRD